MSRECRHPASKPPRNTEDSGRATMDARPPPVWSTFGEKKESGKRVRSTMSVMAKRRRREEAKHERRAEEEQGGGGAATRERADARGAGERERCLEADAQIDALV